MKQYKISTEKQMWVSRHDVFSNSLAKNIPEDRSLVKGSLNVLPVCFFWEKWHREPCFLHTSKAKWSLKQFISSASWPAFFLPSGRKTEGCEWAGALHLEHFCAQGKHGTKDCLNFKIRCHVIQKKKLKKKKVGRGEREEESFHSDLCCKYLSVVEQCLQNKMVN